MAGEREWQKSVTRLEAHGLLTSFKSDLRRFDFHKSLPGPGVVTSAALAKAAIEHPAYDATWEVLSGDGLEIDDARRCVDQFARDRFKRGCIVFQTVVVEGNRERHMQVIYLEKTDGRLVPYVLDSNGAKGSGIFVFGAGVNAVRQLCASQDIRRIYSVEPNRQHSKYGCHAFALIDAVALCTLRKTLSWSLEGTSIVSTRSIDLFDVVDAMHEHSHDKVNADRNGACFYTEVMGRGQIPFKFIADLPPLMDVATQSRIMFERLPVPPGVVVGGRNTLSSQLYSLLERYEWQASVFDKLNDLEREIEALAQMRVVPDDRVEDRLIAKLIFLQGR